MTRVRLLTLHGLHPACLCGLHSLSQLQVSLTAALRAGRVFSLKRYQPNAGHERLLSKHRQAFEEAGRADAERQRSLKHRRCTSQTAPGASSGACTAAGATSRAQRGQPRRHDSASPAARAGLLWRGVLQTRLHAQADTSKLTQNSMCKKPEHLTSQRWRHCACTDLHVALASPLCAREHGVSDACHSALKRSNSVTCPADPGLHLALP